MEIKTEEYEEYLKEKYLTFHEASLMLDISEEELMELVRRHEVPTHQVAGAFLRIKKTDVEELKNKWRIERELFPMQKDSYFSHASTVERAGLAEKMADFWYFNDFYIICSGLIIILLYFIISSQ